MMGGNVIQLLGTLNIAAGLAENLDVLYTIFFKPEVNSKLVILAIQSCHLHVRLKSSD